MNLIDRLNKYEEPEKISHTDLSGVGRGIYFTLPSSESYISGDTIDGRLAPPDYLVDTIATYTGETLTPETINRISNSVSNRIIEMLTERGAI